MRLALLVAGLVLAAVACAGAGRGSEPESHVVLVSIDGLRPEFYLEETSPAPTLRQLARSGAQARAVETVFPSVTYPSHATIATGVRPHRHGVAFNVQFDPDGERGRWYEEAADLQAPPIWEWARAAGRRTAAVSWPSTLGARIDWLLPERDYYARGEPLAVLERAVAPGLFQQLGVTPRAEMFRNIVEWDAFLTATAAAMIRAGRPHLLMLHLVQLDYHQHRGGRDGAEVRPALARVDAHLAELRRAVADAGLAPRTTFVITGDHGFEDVQRTAFPNQILSEAGLRACPRPGREWRATAHLAGAAAAVFVNPKGDEATAARAEAALRQSAGGRLTVMSRRDLDALGAMPGAAFGLEAAPGFQLAGSCRRRAGGAEAEGGTLAGTHGYLPSRPRMATGFVAAGPGVRSGIVIERMGLVDVAPTVARLLGVAAPPVEGRVLAEALR